MVGFIHENLSRAIQEEAFVCFDRDVREIGKSTQVFGVMLYSIKSMT